MIWVRLRDMVRVGFGDAGRVGVRSRLVSADIYKEKCRALRDTTGQRVFAIVDHSRDLFLVIFCQESK